VSMDPNLGEAAGAVRTAIDLHEAIASAWDDRYKRGGFRRRSEFFAREILSSIPAGGKWLDAGCGSGYFSRMIVPRGVTVVGVDAAPAMIAASRVKAVKEGVADRIVFQQISGLYTLPFESGRFHGCLCLSVLEYLDNPQAALREICRVLRPDGRLILSVPNRHSLLRRVQATFSRTSQATRFKRNVDYLAFSRFAVGRVEMEQLLEAAGFSVAQIWEFDPVIPHAMSRYLSGSLLFTLAVKFPRPLRVR
jgi:SAM-dependent methyltransferase